MDQATAARHRLEAMETRAYPLCRTATLRRRPGPGGANRRQPTWPLAAQQQSRAHLCPTKCLLHLARLCSPRGSQATLIYRTAVYGPVCTVVWEGEAARPPPIPIAPSSSAVSAGGKPVCFLIGIVSVMTLRGRRGKSPPGV